MAACPQTERQSVLDHGRSVWSWMQDLLGYLDGHDLERVWRLPSWLVENRDLLRKALLPTSVIETFTVYHDCGKPFCREVDAEGKPHFPNHAEKSAEIWLQVTPVSQSQQQVARLMAMDMDIHRLKAIDVEEFSRRPEAATLLLAGLAEIHSNTVMFGGMESASFKQKWRQLDRRGAAVVRSLGR